MYDMLKPAGSIWSFWLIHNTYHQTAMDKWTDIGLLSYHMPCIYLADTFGGKTL